MDELWIEYVYWTNRELYTLLLLTERTSFAGLSFGEDFTEPKSEEEMHEILSSLYRKGVIDWREGKAEVVSPYREILLTLKNAKYFIYALRSALVLPKTAYFDNERIVMLEQSEQTEGMVRIGRMDIETFFRLLWGEGFFAESIEDWEKPEQEAEIWDMEKSPDAFFEEENVIAVFEKRDAAEGDVMRRFIVYDEGMRCSILVQEEKKSYFVPCDTKETRKLFFT